MLSGPVFCDTEMKQYKIIVAYDGTEYVGWIQQKGYPSVVQMLQDCFWDVFGHRISIVGASKTDSGVHALGQVAVFKTDIPIDPVRMRAAWNNRLPSSIIIRSLIHDDHFHPHKQVKQKVYYYHIFFDRPLPFVARYGTYISRPIRRDIFEKALKLFEGTHDFSAFYTGNDRHDTIRTIDEIKIEFLKRYQACRVVVIGQRFLRHMVRRIVGAALAVASYKDITLDDIRCALHTGSMHAQLLTAPAQGLLLRKIIYRRAHE